MDEMLTNRAFLQVVDCGSFSAAAAEIGVSVATVARQVNSLEARLGVQLLHRTTRTLSLTDAREDLVAQGVDVAVWLGSLEDSSLIARRLSHGKRLVCCSPAYAAKRGLPEEPKDLAQHNCIVYGAKSYDSSWRFTRDGTTPICTPGVKPSPTFQRLASSARAATKSP